MAITSTPSRKYTDNFRKLRRYLQGRGVNLRETIVGPFDPYVAETRLAVPGMHADDAIISVFDMDNLVDMTGYLDDGGDAASAVIPNTSANKDITFTALRTGLGGNDIYVKAEAAKDSAGAAVNDAPLSVTIGQYDVVFRSTGHSGKTGILVSLATNGSGAALTTGENDAVLVVAAVLDAQEAMIGDAIVDAVLNGTGDVDWTAVGPTALTGGTSFNQGPAKASLSLPVVSAGDNVIRLVAREAGDTGNGITIALTENGALSVAVSGDPGDIVVEYDDLVTTAKEIVDAINADADASALVIASILPSNSAGDDIAEDDFAEDNLVGGLDSGIRMSTSMVGVKLKVMWLTRNDG